LREHFYVVESGALAKRFGAVTAFPGPGLRVERRMRARAKAIVVE
jgi:hypothetical protein